MDLFVTLERYLQVAAEAKIKKYRNMYNLVARNIGFMPLVVSTSGRLHMDFIRLACLHAAQEATQ
jgi:hypothetical protein